MQQPSMVHFGLKASRRQAKLIHTIRGRMNLRDDQVLGDEEQLGSRDRLVYSGSKEDVKKSGISAHRSLLIDHHP